MQRSRSDKPKLPGGEVETLSPQELAVRLEESVLGMYVSLMRQGWTLPEIDNADFPYLLRIFAYAREHPEGVQEKYIDEVL